MKAAIRRSILACVALFYASLPSHAAVIGVFSEVGSDVALTTSGELDLTGLTFFTSGGRYGAALNPSEGAFGTGPTGGGSPNADVYQGFTSLPANIGPGNGIVPDEGSVSGLLLRSDVLVNGVPGGLYVPNGYQSGDQIFGTALFRNATFESLGLTQGRYVYAWEADQVVLQVGVIPLPAAAWMLLSALGGLALVRRHQKDPLIA